MIGQYLGGLSIRNRHKDKALNGEIDIFLM